MKVLDIVYETLQGEEMMVTQIVGDTVTVIHMDLETTNVFFAGNLTVCENQPGSRRMWLEDSDTIRAQMGH